MILTAHLFKPLHGKLIELLRSLSAEDWQKPTLAKQWTVKDIAAHLLDTTVRELAERDGHFVEPLSPINSYRDLVDYLNHLNAEWVVAMRRVSPQVLTDMMEDTGKQQANYIESLDMETNAPYSVAWAGEDLSATWFHIAREYTERWHHQQQIREAVGKPGITSRELFYPCIATFLCGLPHTYRNVKAEAGTAIHIIIETEIGGDWYLVSDGKRWQLSTEKPTRIAATISLPPDVAWKLFTKGLTADEAKEKVTLSGDEALASVALNLLAIMA